MAGSSRQLRTPDSDQRPPRAFILKILFILSPPREVRGRYRRPGLPAGTQSGESDRAVCR